MEVLVFILGLLFIIATDDLANNLATRKVGLKFILLACATVLTYNLTAYGLVSKHVDMYVANSLNGTEFAEPYVVEETTIYRPYSIFGDQKRYDIIDIDDLYPDEEKKNVNN